MSDKGKAKIKTDIFTKEGKMKTVIAWIEVSVLVLTFLFGYGCGQRHMPPKYIFLPNASISFDASRPWAEHTLEERIFMAMFSTNHSRLNETDIQEIRERWGQQPK